MTTCIVSFFALSTTYTEYLNNWMKRNVKNNGDNNSDSGVSRLEAWVCIVCLILAAVHWTQYVA